MIVTLSTYINEQTYLLKKVTNHNSNHSTTTHHSKHCHQKWHSFFNQGHLKKMDWKVTRKFFRSVNITDRKKLYVSFWSFLLHMKTCKKIFWKISIFCWGFCNVFESSTVLGKVDVATILLMPHPCYSHYFTITL